MKLAFYIARRYLFAKKSHNAINIISTVSVCGVVVATIAMVCTLSVYNGFKGLNTNLFSVFDPDLKITPVEGKVFDPTTEEMKRACRLPEIQLCCDVLQENALISYGDRQEICVLKGVDTTFRDLVKIDQSIIDGEFVLNDGDFAGGVLGIGLTNSLGVNVAFVRPLEIYMPIRDRQINMADPSSSIRLEYALIKGVYYTNQPAYDERFMFIPLSLMRSMLNYEKEVSALEIKLVQGTNVSLVKKQIKSIIGSGFEVKDRHEQQEATYKMVQIEKWVTYLLLCFILILALFNVLGSLAILMIEKEEDVGKLRSMGADNKLINKIFLVEGWMISLLGAVIGIVIGLILCFLQQYFGLIKMGETAGVLVIDSFPVEVEWADVLIIFVTVVVIGFTSVLYPVHYLGKKWLNKTLAIGLLIPLLMSCGGQKKSSDADNFDTIGEIAVTIEPLRYFTEKIAGDDYKVFSVVPVGQGPETYDPSPREMMRVGNGTAYFHIGQLALEQALVKSVKENNSNTRLFDLSEGMNFHIESHVQNNTHDHSESHDHAHGEHDPHIWSSFTGARVISDNIYNALSSLDKEKQDFFKTRYLHLVSELELLEKSMHDQLDTLSCRGFVIFHPALTYFADEFGLKQYSIEEDGKEPAPSSLKKLIDESRAAGVKVVFVQMEFDRKHAEQIAMEIGAKVVTINPLDRSWDEQMKRIVQALVTYGEID